MLLYKSFDDNGIACPSLSSFQISFSTFVITISDTCEGSKEQLEVIIATFAGLYLSL